MGSLCRFPIKWIDLYKNLEHFKVVLWVQHFVVNKQQWSTTNSGKLRTVAQKQRNTTVQNGCISNILKQVSTIFYN